MQIKDNITATSNPKVATLKSPIKMVKLRSKDNVSKQADKLMEPTWNINDRPNEVANEIPANIATQQEVVTKVEQPEVASEVRPKVEEKEESSQLPLTSEEVIRSKKDTLGIDAYNDIESNIVNLASYQNARRLRVNEVVVGNANRERNINGIERVKEEKIVSTNEPNNRAFNFGNLENMSTIQPKETEFQNDPFEYNNTKLDEWLNKETAPIKNGNDKVLNEVNELQAKLNDNASSLATQKEILEALRARIANNEALVRAKKQELEEENMNVTRELNDVLAEINQLTNIASEQEAFLGISTDEEIGRSRAA